MKLPNLSAWGLEHKQFIAFLIVMLSAAGALSYFSLGRAEDPSFTFKVWWYARCGRAQRRRRLNAN